MTYTRTGTGTPPKIRYVPDVPTPPSLLAERAARDVERPVVWLLQHRGRNRAQRREDGQRGSSARRRGGNDTYRNTALDGLRPVGAGRRGRRAARWLVGAGA